MATAVASAPVPVPASVSSTTEKDVPPAIVTITPATSTASVATTATTDPAATLPLTSTQSLSITLPLGTSTIVGSTLSAALASTSLAPPSPSAASTSTRASTPGTPGSATTPTTAGTTVRKKESPEKRQRRLAAEREAKRIADEQAKANRVFKSTARAKKLFAQWDVNKDKWLSQQEFVDGCTKFAPTEFPITPAQALALFHDCDVNKDGKIVWAEFNARFCGHLEGLATLKSPEKKVTQPIQEPKRDKKDAANFTVADGRTLLESLYDGGKRRYKSIDIGKLKAVSNTGLKKLVGQILMAEKEEAKAQKREVEEWAAGAISQGGVNPKDIDKLFESLDEKKTGRIDLTEFYERVRQKPSTARSHKKKTSSKKKKKQLPTNGLPQAHVMVTVKAEHLRDFVSDAILNTIGCPQEIRAHPVLKHWGDEERAKKGLATVGPGYKQNIFVSDRTRVRSVVAMENEIVIFATYRTEYTSMARTESLWHARLSLTLDEILQSCEVREKRVWIDGEIDREADGDVFESWSVYCGEEIEGEEGPIPILA